MVARGGVRGIEADGADFGIGQALACILQNRLQRALVPEVLNSENAKEDDLRFLHRARGDGFFFGGLGHLVFDGRTHEAANLAFNALVACRSELATIRRRVRAIFQMFQPSSSSEYWRCHGSVGFYRAELTS